MKLGRFSLLLALLALLAWAQAASAEDPLSIKIADFQEEAGSMSLTVSAYSSNGRSLSGLTASNFTADLDGTALPIRDVNPLANSPDPASVLLLVDLSGSMYGDPITQAKSAMHAFVDSLQPGDSVALTTFSTGVTRIVGFTANHSVVTSAIDALQARGETALYDALIAASGDAANSPPGQRLIVLLSDGRANIGAEKRAASIAAAKSANVSVIAVGLGPDVDRQYLQELTGGTGGRLIEAPTPASLHDAYSQLATSIRSRYELTISVPPSVDRTVPGTLHVGATYRGSTATSQMPLGPLPGAVPPPLDFQLSGLAGGQKIRKPVTLTPLPPAGVDVVEVQYTLDGNSIGTRTGEDASFELDPAQLTPGSHTLSVQVKTASGRTGSADIAFIALAPPAPSKGSSLPLIPILVLLLGSVAVFFAGKFVIKRSRMQPAYVVERVKPWAETPSSSEVPAMAEGWAERLAKVKESSPPAVEKPVGRLVVMNENAVRSGSLDAIAEYDLYSSPLTLGTGDQVDIALEDPSGAIAAEEARIWVQRGRLVYHKLTTLSAMATEGITAGWQFLENGEDVRLGPYRLVFQRYEMVREDEPEQQQEPSHLPQEHGMKLQTPWQDAGAYSAQELPATSLDQNSAADPFSREEQPEYDSTSAEDGGDYKTA